MNPFLTNNSSNPFNYGSSAPTAFNNSSSNKNPFTITSSINTNNPALLQTNKYNPFLPTNNNTTTNNTSNNNNDNSFSIFNGNNNKSNNPFVSLSDNNNTQNKSSYSFSSSTNTNPFLQSNNNNFSNNNRLNLTPNNNNNKTENNFLNFSFSKPDNNNSNINTNSNANNTFNISNGGINNNNPINSSNSNNTFSIFNNNNSNKNNNVNNNNFISTLNKQSNNNNFSSQNSNLNTNNNNSNPFNSIFNTKKNDNNINNINTNNNNNNSNNPFQNLNNTWSFNLNNNYNDANKIFSFNGLNNNYNINNINTSFLNNNNKNIFNNNSFNILENDYNIFSNTNKIGNNDIIDDLQELYNSTAINEKSENNSKNNIKKSVPLSHIISEHINKENANKEIIDKIFERNYKNNLNNLSDTNYNYFNNNEYTDGLSLYKTKKKKEKLRREEEKNYQKFLKNMYSYNDKEKIKEILLRNNRTNKVSKTQGINDKKNIENMSKKDNEKSMNETQLILNRKINIENKDVSKISKINDNKSNNLENHIIIKKSNKNDNIDLSFIDDVNKDIIISNNINDKKEETDNHDSKEKLIYDISIIVKNKEDEEIFQKSILINESTKYELDLDELFFMITSILKERHISYKYGLSYKIGYMDLEEKVGKINILNYDILSVSTGKDNKNTKKLDMEIKIINGNNLPSEDYIENPQLFCKLTKSYKIIPKLSIVNKFNLLEYNNGLKIVLKHLSIIFIKDETYDLGMVNFDEFSCNDDTEIFFDSNRFEKSNSTMKKIYDNKIILTYDGIGTKYKNNLINRNIVRDYFRNRYFFEKYKFDDFNKQIIISTKIKYLLIPEEESKIQYEEFLKNINK